MFPVLVSFLEGEDDEDEEDEEEEDEEEEDEEEDEEDKDADSLDEALGDTELPGFTLPGITSQEPGLEQENVVSLEGVTFQVPDAVQWEQQNQGLGESCVSLLLPSPQLTFLRRQLPFTGIDYGAKWIFFLWMFHLGSSSHFFLQYVYIYALQ